MQVVAPEGWIAKRLAVAVAILILYIVHYVTLGLIHGMGKGENKDYINRRVFLYSISALLSMSYIQTSTFSTVLAWLTLIPLIILHITQFAQDIPKINSQKDNLWMGYYFLQFVWFMGIIIDFYQE